jgi:hypothetical protein
MFGQWIDINTFLIYNTIMQIQTALDWQEVSDRLKTDLHRIGYNPDLKKMYDNIQLMVTELSKLEVNGRRLRTTNFTQTEVDKINKAIDHLEKLILMGLLMK